MSEPELEREIDQRFVEPLLPVEKRLIGWSLGVGAVSLVTLAIVSRYLPF
ncbi:MAG TPA: hypothetical protein VK446_12950 [Methylocystis sp.]|nr:hypothetical protein [Methylocystis sp.]